MPRGNDASDDRAADDGSVVEVIEVREREGRPEELFAEVAGRLPRVN
jgi:hypothetical protein